MPLPTPDPQGKSSVFVKLLYYSKEDGKLQCTRKTVKVLRSYINSAQFQGVIQDVLGIKCDIILKRRSRRHRDFVNLSSDADFKALMRSLKVKNYIKLVVIDSDHIKPFELSDALFKDPVDGASFAETAFDEKYFSSTETSSGEQSNDVDAKVSTSDESKSVSDAPAATLSSPVLGDDILKKVVSFLGENGLFKDLNTSIDDLNRNLMEIVDSKKANKESSGNVSCNKAVHYRIYCDGCDFHGENWIAGNRYKCLICDDYDLCEACEKKGVVTGKHCNNHVMAKIIEPVGKFTKKDFSAKALSRMIDGRNGVAVRVETKNPCIISKPNCNAGKPHPGIVCDGCHPHDFGTDLRGIRYKCLECSDYDLCEKCVLNDTTTLSHSNKHTMLRIPGPSGTYPLIRPHFSELTNASSCRQANVSPSIIAHAYCDACKQDNRFTEDIKGLRYKCLSCSNFDLCQSCYSNNAEVGSHSCSHPMAAVMPAKQMHFSSVFSNSCNEPPVKDLENAYCDSCSDKDSAVYIEGLRFHCRDCYNFDLCKTCYDKRVSVNCHSPEHNMVAMLPAAMTDKFVFRDGLEPTVTTDKVIDLGFKRDSDLGRKVEQLFAGDNGLKKLEELIAKAEKFDQLAALSEKQDPEEIVEEIKQMVTSAGETQKAVKESDEVMQAASVPEQLLQTEEKEEIEHVQEKEDIEDDEAKEKEEIKDVDNNDIYESSSSNSTLLHSKSSSSIIILPKLLKESSSYLQEGSGFVTPVTLSPADSTDAASVTDNLDEDDGYVISADHDVVSSGWDSEASYSNDDLANEYEILDSDIEM